MKKSKISILKPRIGGDFSHRSPKRSIFQYMLVMFSNYIILAYVQIVVNLCCTPDTLRVFVRFYFQVLLFRADCL